MTTGIFATIKLKPFWVYQKILQEQRMPVHTSTGAEMRIFICSFLRMKALCASDTC
jgi:hypothetical protein